MRKFELPMQHTIRTNDHGVVVLEEYKVDGQLHRLPEDGPAVIRRNDRCVVLLEQFRLRGRLHRPPEDGAGVYTAQRRWRCDL